MDIFNIVITIILAAVAVAGGIFGILAYKKQSKQAITQEDALKFQFANQEELRKKEHLAQEERQKLRTTEQFDKLKDELSEQKASADKNNTTINLRLLSIEKKVDKFEDMHTQIELIKRDSNNILEMVKEIKDQQRLNVNAIKSIADAPPLPTKRRTYTRKK